MSTDTKPYLFEMQATKVVVVWADSFEEAQQIAEDDHLSSSRDWEGMECTASGVPLTDEQAKAEIRHGAIEDKA